MERPSWHYWQLLQALQSPTLTTDKLVQHTTSLLSGPSTLLCFINGNINEIQVRQQFCVSIICSVTSPHTYYALRVR